MIIRTTKDLLEVLEIQHKIHNALRPLDIVLQGGLIAIVGHTFLMVDDTHIGDEAGGGRFLHVSNTWPGNRLTFLLGWAETEEPVIRESTGTQPEIQLGKATPEAEDLPVYESLLKILSEALPQQVA